MTETPQTMAGDDDPNRPVVGGLYWVESWLYGGNDPKEDRPLVVVRAPKKMLDMVHVITRTTDTSRTGVQHPPDPERGLLKPGVFRLKFYRRIPAELFRPPAVTRVGTLPEPYCTQVLELWENG